MKLNQHRFTEHTPVVDLVHYRKECGHLPHEDCRCRKEIWLGYEEWLAEREMEEA